VQNEKLAERSYVSPRGIYLAEFSFFREEAVPKSFQSLRQRIFCKKIENPIFPLS